MSCNPRPPPDQPLIIRMSQNFAAPIRFVLEWILPYALAVGLMFFGGIAVALGCGWKPENVKEKEEREAKRAGLEGELGIRAGDEESDGKTEVQRLRVELECLEEMRRERMVRVVNSIQ